MEHGGTHIQQEIRCREGGNVGDVWKKEQEDGLEDIDVEIGLADGEGLNEYWKNNH